MCDSHVSEVCIFSLECLKYSYATKKSSIAVLTDFSNLSAPIKRLMQVWRICWSCWNMHENIPLFRQKSRDMRKNVKVVVVSCKIAVITNYSVRHTALLQSCANWHSLCWLSIMRFVNHANRRHFIPLFYVTCKK